MLILEFDELNTRLVALNDLYNVVPELNAVTSYVNLSYITVIGSHEALFILLKYASPPYEIQVT